jgi:hypothetical protein
MVAARPEGFAFVLWSPLHNAARFDTKLKEQLRRDLLVGGDGRQPGIGERSPLRGRELTDSNHDEPPRTTVAQLKLPPHRGSRLPTIRRLRQPAVVLGPKACPAGILDAISKPGAP